MYNEPARKKPHEMPTEICGRLAACAWRAMEKQLYIMLRLHTGNLGQVRREMYRDRVAQTIISNGARYYKSTCVHGEPDEIGLSRFPPDSCGFMYKPRGYNPEEENWNTRGPAGLRTRLVYDTCVWLLKFKRLEESTGCVSSGTWLQYQYNSTYHCHRPMDNQLLTTWSKQTDR